nr:hypothetical protein [Tanacetum cinerariifolium]
MCCDIDNVGFGEDDDGVEDEGFGSVTVNSCSFSEGTVYEVHRHGTKSLPDPASKKKGRLYWGFVEMVTTNIQDIKDALKGEEYETKTRGHRHKPPARALGEGEASFLLQIKNPTQKGRNEFRGLKIKRKPVFPKHLQERFGELRYHAADPPDFLNYQGCEFLLISDEASDNIHEELGVDIHEDSSCSDLINTFGAETSTDALIKGIWV